MEELLGLIRFEVVLGREPVLKMPLREYRSKVRHVRHSRSRCGSRTERSIASQSMGQLPPNRLPRHTSNSSLILAVTIAVAAHIVVMCCILIQIDQLSLPGIGLIGYGGA